MCAFAELLSLNVSKQVSHWYSTYSCILVPSYTISFPTDRQPSVIISGLRFDWKSEQGRILSDSDFGQTNPDPDRASHFVLVPFVMLIRLLGSCEYATVGGG